MMTAIVQFKRPNPVSRDRAQELFLGTAAKYLDVKGTALMSWSRATEPIGQRSSRCLKGTKGRKGERTCSKYCPMAPTV